MERFPFGSYAVTDRTGDHLTCTCPRYKRRARQQNRPSVPWCEHIVGLLRDRRDHIDGHAALDVPMFMSAERELSLKVTIGNPDETGQKSVEFWFDGQPTVVGYVDSSRSRAAIRDLLLPYLIDAYFTHACPRCHRRRGDVTRQGLNSPAEQATAAYEAGFLLKMGACPDCDTSDLVPDPNPNPRSADD